MKPQSWLMLALTGILALPVQALEDPTRPPDFQTAPSAPAAPERRFDLDSIVIGPERRVAVINGMARREGEQFDGARVRRIQPGQVEILVGGRVRVLQLQTLPRIRVTQ